MAQSNSVKTFDHDLNSKSILDIIRERPAMYIGEHTLTGLWFYLHGFQLAEMLHGIKASTPLPRDFADWVAYRLHLDSNWSGFWQRAILSRVRNEQLALTRFFELRDEYLGRVPKVVATIREDCREHRVGQRDPDGQIAWRTELFPESLRIVVYTDDPGFFIVADENIDFFFASGWFFSAFDYMLGLKLPEKQFEVHDQRTWDRLLTENKKHKKRLAGRRARIQRKSGIAEKQ